MDVGELKNLVTAILKSFWPGGSSAPSHGSTKGAALSVPNSNIDIMSDATATAAIVASAQTAYDQPIDIKKIDIEDVGIDSLIARWVSVDAMPDVPGGPGGPGAGSGDGFTRGYAIVTISGIPEMTESNKDQLNKRIMGCVRNDENSWFIGIFHRYLDADLASYDPPAGYESATFWPTWRIEAGRSGHIVEWHIFDSSPLLESTAQFKIEWDAGSITVTNLDTGDEQIVSAGSGLNIDKVCNSSECSKWGWSFSGDCEEEEFVGYE